MSKERLSGSGRGAFPGLRRRAELSRVLRGDGRGSHRCRFRRRRRAGSLFNLRTLALRTSSLGAKLGANVGRCRATSGHIGPGLPQVNSSYADAQLHPAIAGAYMACRRSGVQIPLAPPFFVYLFE